MCFLRIVCLFRHSDVRWFYSAFLVFIFLIHVFLLHRWHSAQIALCTIARTHSDRIYFNVSRDANTTTDHSLLVNGIITR